MSGTCMSQAQLRHIAIYAIELSRASRRSLYPWEQSRKRERALSGYRNAAVTSAIANSFTSQPVSCPATIIQCSFMNEKLVR